MQTCREMVDTMLAEVGAGKRVFGIFQGHPGVFAWRRHKAIEIARKDAHLAYKEPGMSDQDRLYADLGIGPDKFGNESSS